MIDSGTAGLARGRAALESYKEVFRAMPDYRVEFPSIMYSGDTIIFEGFVHATFTGPMTSPEAKSLPGKERTCSLSVLCQDFDRRADRRREVLF